MSIDAEELDANIYEAVFRLLHSDRIGDDLIPKGLSNNHANLELWNTNKCSEQPDTNEQLR